MARTLPNHPMPRNRPKWRVLLRAQLATVTGGLAPDVYANAWWDWYLNLAKDPPKQHEIMQDALAKTIDSWTFALRAFSGQPLPPAEGDDRFGADAWAGWPYNVYARSYRNYSDWWQKAWSGVAGRRARERAHAGFRGAQRLRGRLPGPLPGHQPRTARHHPRRSRRESGARLPSLARGHQAHRRRQATARYRKIRRRPRCRRNARQGRAAQRADRIDPVFAGDRDGLCRADPDRAGLDHEVLHPRPVGEKFLGAIPGLAGSHGVHRIVEESDSERPRARHGRLPAAWRTGRVRRRIAQSYRSGKSMRSATASAAPCCRSPPRCTPPKATNGWRA